jgi:hypothetical protein
MKTSDELFIERIISFLKTLRRKNIKPLREICKYILKKNLLFEMCFLVSLLLCAELHNLKNEKFLYSPGYTRSWQAVKGNLHPPLSPHNARVNKIRWRLLMFLEKGEAGGFFTNEKSHYQKITVSCFFFLYQ